MTENNHLCDLWEHTIVKVFPKSELELMLKEWVIFNQLENFNSILNYTIEDFTPSGNLCYINENGEILYQTPLHELFNLRWYIKHLTLSHENWMKQTNWKFMKYVIHHKHSMTPQQLKKKPFKEIIKIGHEKLDTEERESNNEEEESITSSGMSNQDSESDTTTNDTEESKPTETLQIHYVCNTTTYDEDDSIQDEDE